MSHLSTAAEMTIGSDLRIVGCNAEWRRLNLPGGKAGAHERIGKIFPDSDVAACVLDVLASGEPSEELLVRMDGGRYLLSSFYPSPSAANPKRVRMQAWAMRAQMLVDGYSGEILETFEEEASLPPVPTFRAALESAIAKGSHYLGKFNHRTPDGRDVVLESVLALVDEGRGN